MYQILKTNRNSKILNKLLKVINSLKYVKSYFQNGGYVFEPQTEDSKHILFGLITLYKLESKLIFIGELCESN